MKLDVFRLKLALRQPPDREPHVGGQPYYNPRSTHRMIL